MIWWIIWIVSAIYCFVRLFKGYKKRSLDGVIGVTPGFDALIFLAGAPLFAIIDLGITWYNRVHKD
jgi:hypothetical protein